MSGPASAPAPNNISVKIQLVTPAPLNINNGNRVTALRWANIFKTLGHRVRVRQVYDGKPCDVLIALHALRSAESIRRFHAMQPSKPLIVVLTGTDVYRDIHKSKKAQQSLELATRIVALQSMALRELPSKFRAKAKVIYQSAESLQLTNRNANGHFNICVVGHLRDEKDPLRTALAVRDLAPASKIQVTHIGQALDKKLGAKTRAETLRNSRYRWLGQLSHRKTREQLAQSQLVCITSRIEGSSNVLSEALASRVPVICSKIPGLIGTLGNSFSGFYPVGDTDKLRRLLQRAETDKKFYRALKRQCRSFAHKVKPQQELAAWKNLFRELA